MDQDQLIAYLDRRFDENAQQIAALRAENAQQTAALRAENAQQTAALRAENAQQTAALRAELAAFRQEANQRFERLEDADRETHVLIEGVRHELRLVAEGFVGTNQRLDRLQTEVTLVFDQVRGWIEPYYRSLDGRMKVMEGWAERQNKDVFDVVRRILRGSALPPSIPSE